MLSGDLSDSDASIEQRGRLMASKNGLTDRQRIFCAEYLKDVNATQAAIRAGYSKRTAKMQGSRLMTNDDVRVEINRGIERRNEQAGVDARFVLEGLLKIYKNASSERIALRALELIGKHVEVSAFRENVVLQRADELIERMRQGVERARQRSRERLERSNGRNDVAEESA